MAAIRLRTPLTDASGPWRLRVPIISAPMAGASGGALAAAVSNAGALGFIAVGHGTDLAQLRSEVAAFRRAAPEGRLALGFIGFSSCCTTAPYSGHPPSQQRQQGVEQTEGDGEAGMGVLEEVLAEHRPAFVQFFAPALVQGGRNVAVAQAAGAAVLAQVGTLAEAREAVAAGVDAVITQGKEAGGHGLRAELGSGTLSLARVVVRLVAGDGDDTEEERAAHATKRRKISERGRRTPVVLAAGGIADGHCLASCLALGCDGAVVGTRFWASEEALGYRAIKAALVGGTGSGSRGTSCDDVVRTTVFDALQNSYSGNPWPQPYDSVGALRNKTTDAWEGKPRELQEAIRESSAGTAQAEASATVRDFRAASAAGDPSRAVVLAGEGVGLIHSIKSAGVLVHEMEQECVGALECLGRVTAAM